MSTDTVLFVGHVNWDQLYHIERVPDPDKSAPASLIQSGVGGSASNSAVSYSSLGGKSVLVGSIGNDPSGQNIREYLDNRDLQYHLPEKDPHTTQIMAMVTDDTDPRYIHHHTEKGYVSPEEVPESLLSDCSHVHITSFDVEMASEFAEYAQEHNKSISFNPTQQYQDRQLNRVVELADLVILNENEFMIFRNRYNFEKMRDDTIIVVTNGSAGCSVYTSEDEYNHEGYRVSSVTDPIGAGDAFVAGFLHSWLAEPEEYMDHISFANACGASAVQTAGSSDSLNPEEIIHSR